MNRAAEAQLLGQPHVQVTPPPATGPGGLPLLSNCGPGPLLRYHVVLFSGMQRTATASGMNTGCTSQAMATWMWASITVAVTVIVTLIIIVTVT